MRKRRRGFLGLFAFLVLGMFSVHGQEQPENLIFQGQVNDERGQAIPGCSVFISGTSTGASTDATGRFYFETKNLPSNNIRLIVSNIAYQTYSVNLEPPFSNNEIRLQVTLKEKVEELGEVTVESKQPKTWKKNLRKFNEIFLGSTDNGRKARIQNVEILDLNRMGGKLIARSKHSLLVSNPNLGYDVSFRLKSFTWDLGQNSGGFYFDYIRFDEKTATHADETRQWIRNRRDLYMRSQKHFFSLLNRDLNPKDFGFEFINGRLKKQDYFKSISYNRLYELGVRNVEPKTYNDVYVYFMTETTNRRVEIQQWNSHTNIISVARDAPILVDSFGNIINIREVSVGGFWGELRAADMLPLEYTPF